MKLKSILFILFVILGVSSLSVSAQTGAANSCDPKQVVCCDGKQAICCNGRKARDLVIEGKNFIICEGQAVASDRCKLPASSVSKSFCGTSLRTLPSLAQMKLDGDNKPPVGFSLLEVETVCTPEQKSFLKDGIFVNVGWNYHLQGKPGSLILIKRAFVHRAGLDSCEKDGNMIMKLIIREKDARNLELAQAKGSLFYIPVKENS